MRTVEIPGAFPHTPDGLPTSSSTVPEGIAPCRSASWGDVRVSVKLYVSECANVRTFSSRYSMWQSEYSPRAQKKHEPQKDVEGHHDSVTTFQVLHRGANLLDHADDS